MVMQMRFLANQCKGQGSGEVGGQTRPHTVKSRPSEHLYEEVAEGIHLTWASPSAAKKVTRWETSNIYQTTDK